MSRSAGRLSMISDALITVTHNSLQIADLILPNAPPRLVIVLCKKMTFVAGSFFSERKR